MLRGGIRRFDLYDFFSVFLPGATALLGVVPFLPKDTKLGPGLVGALLVLGFVAGRGVHSIAITVQDKFGGTSHRDKFNTEVAGNGEIGELLIDEFHEECNQVYDGVDFNDLGEADSNAVYTLARSSVHMDSRGRSRTFQAVYAFHRSMWIVTFGLSLLYTAYGVGSTFGLFEGSASYLSFLGSLELPTLGLIGGPLLTTLTAYKVSRNGMDRHRENYVKYLVADFVTLYRAGDDSDDGDPTSAGREKPPRR